MTAPNKKVVKILLLEGNVLSVDCPKCQRSNLELAGGSTALPDEKDLSLFYADDLLECSECNFTCTAEAVSTGDYRNIESCPHCDGRGWIKKDLEESDVSL